MWHILTHTTTTKNLLKILKDGKIGTKDYNHKNIESMVYMYYLSSLLDNSQIKNWNFSYVYFASSMELDPNTLVIIGFNPHILNNKKFVMCDRHAGGECFKQKYKLVESYHNGKKPINFKKINDFINSRITDNITNNLDFSNNIFQAKAKLIRYYKAGLRKFYSYVDNKFHDLKKVEKINNKIKEIENSTDDKVLDMYNKIFKINHMKLEEQSKYVESHEVVFKDKLDIKDINFIMISKTRKDEFKTELKKLCPDYIKIIEIEPNDFQKYTKRIQKVLEKNSECIQL